MHEQDVLKILADHGLHLADVDLKDGWDHLDEETLQRMARVASVNKILSKSKGCEPLDWKPPPSAYGDEEDFAKEESGTLDIVEWRRVRGHHGTMLGMGLSRVAFDHMLKMCRSKKALCMRGNPDECKKYLQAGLKAYSNRQIMKAKDKRIMMFIAPDLEKNAKVAVAKARAAATV